MTPKLNAAVARELLAETAPDASNGDSGTRARPLGVDVASVGAGWFSRLASGLRALSDTQLALLLGVAMFAFAAWPLALTEVPPYQDLPNHLAAVTVIQNADLYPEFTFNGFLKTNAALFAWLMLAGQLIGVKLAAKTFALGVLAANALVIPRFVLELTQSRKKMIVACLLAWPTVHNWFVSMGMLDFALGVPLSMATLILLKRRSDSPSRANAFAILAVGIATWYTHVFSLLVVHLLVFLHVAQQRTWRDRIDEAKKLFIPLAPTAALAGLSIYMHLTEPAGAMTGEMRIARLLPPWELAYNLWAEWFWAFTKREIGSIVPCVLLFVFGLLGRKQKPAFFSPISVVVLVMLFVFTPYVATNWFHVNSRFIPYLWLATMLRVPERLPKKLTAALLFCAATYSAGMASDFVRLDRERAEFTAGMGAVPEGSRLLPLIFQAKFTSENTRNLLHAWGYYVMEKHTSAPLLFAHSRSFPVMYSAPPPTRFNHLVLEGFAPSLATPAWMCNTLHENSVIPDDCDAMYRALWADFWREATPRYDHVLLWAATPEARAQMPSWYKLVFEQGKLAIYERQDKTAYAETPY